MNGSRRQRVVLSGNGRATGGNERQLAAIGNESNAGVRDRVKLPFSASIELCGLRDARVRNLVKFMVAHGAIVIIIIIIDLKNTLQIGAAVSILI